MRVLLVSAHGADTTFGGAERYLSDLASGLLARGHEPTILSAFPPREQVGGIHTVVLHGADWRTSEVRRLRNHLGDVVALPSRRLLRALHAARPELVHTNNLPGISTAVWAAAADRGVPVVHTLHDYYLLCPRTTLTHRDGSPCRPHPLLCGARRQRLARHAGGVRAVIAGSEHLVGVHRGFFPRATNAVIRLPIVGDGGRAAPPEALRTLGYIGGLASIKGVQELLEAAPALERLGITLRLAGDGPLRAAVQAAAVRGSVAYDGFVSGPAKAEFMARCDAGIVPSRWDEPSGPPYVVCEWLAAGRPLLASERGGLAEVVASHEAVVGVEPSAAAIASAAARLREEDRWRATVAAVPPTPNGSELERWLDEHEAVYAAA